MSTLTSVGRTFLTTALKAEVKPRPMLKFRRTDDQKANDRATQAFDDYERREKKVIDAIADLAKLSGTQDLVAKFTNEVKAAQVLVANVKSANPEAAAVTFRQAYETLERTKKDIRAAVRARKDMTPDEQEALYKEERTEVDEMRLKLIAQNRDAEEWEEPLVGVLERADAEAKKKDFMTGIEKLGLASTLYKEQLKKAQEARDADLDEARHQAVYEDKRRRIEDGIAEISRLPNTTKYVKKLQGLLVAGDKAVQTKGYKAGYDAIEGLHGTLNDAREASSGFTEKAGDKDFQKERKLAEAALKEYVAVANLADSEGIAGFRKRLDDALKSLEGEPDAKTIQTATDEMKAVAKDVKKVAGDSKTDADEVEKLVTKLQQDLEKDLVRLAPHEVSAPLMSRWQAALAMRGGQQFHDARDELESLDTAVADALKSYKPDEDAWLLRVTQYKKDYKARVDAAKKIRIDGLGPQADSIDIAFQLCRDRIREKNDFKGAAVSAQKALNDAATLELNFKAYEKKKDAIEAEERKFVQKCEQVTAKLQETPKVKDFAKQEIDLSDFETTKETIVKDWNNGFNTLLKPGVKVTDFSAGILTRLDNLIKAIGEALASKDELKERSKKATATNTRKQFDSDVEALGKRIGELELEDPTTAGGLRTKLTNLVKLCQGSFTESHAKALKKLGEEVETAIKGFTDDIKKERKKVQEDAKKVQKRLEKLKNDGNAGYLLSVIERVTAIEAQTETELLTVIKAAGKSLATLALEVTKLEQDNGKKAPQGTQNFKAVQEALEKLREKIKKSEELKDCLYSKYKVLEHRAKKELPPAAAALAPDKALAPDGPIKMLEDEVDKQIAQAKKNQIVRDENKKAIELLRPKLKNLQGVPKFKESLKKRLDRAGTPDENGEARAKSDIAAITELLDMADDPENAALLEQNAITQAHDSEEQKRRWLADSDVFDKNEMRTAEETKTKTRARDLNMALFLQIGKMWSEAKKAASKGDYTSANEKLNTARRVASDFIANPQGGKATARNNLGRVVEKWKQTVSLFLKQMKKLKDGITAEAQGDTTVVLAPITTALTRVTRLFDANVFDPAVATMQDEEKTLADHRTAKEDALQHVRRYQMLLNKDRVLIHLLDDPFPEAPVNLAPFRDRLRDLSLNFQRA